MSHMTGGNRYIYIPKVGRRKIRYYKNGNEYVIVNGKKKKIKKSTNYFIVLKKGDDFFEKIMEGFRASGFPAATVSGIGSLTQITLGYFDREQKVYHKKYLDKIYELISATGNISLKDGAPFAHIHVTIGDSDYKVYGGHLFSAIVAVTGEIELRRVDAPLERKYTADLNMALIDPKTTSSNQ